MNKLRSKSTIYKKKRSELAELRAEAGVLTRTEDILNQRNHLINQQLVSPDEDGVIALCLSSFHDCPVSFFLHDCPVFPWLFHLYMVVLCLSMIVLCLSLHDCPVSFSAWVSCVSMIVLCLSCHDCPVSMIVLCLSVHYCSVILSVIALFIFVQRFSCVFLHNSHASFSPFLPFVLMITPFLPSVISRLLPFHSCPVSFSPWLPCCYFLSPWLLLLFLPLLDCLVPFSSWWLCSFLWLLCSLLSLMALFLSLPDGTVPFSPWWHCSFLSVMALFLSLSDCLVPFSQWLLLSAYDNTAFLSHCQWAPPPSFFVSLYSSAVAILTIFVRFLSLHAALFLSLIITPLLLLPHRALWRRRQGWRVTGRRRRTWRRCRPPRVSWTTSRAARWRTCRRWCAACTPRLQSAAMSWPPSCGKYDLSVRECR